MFKTRLSMPWMPALAVLFGASLAACSGSVDEAPEDPGGGRGGKGGAGGDPEVKPPEPGEREVIDPESGDIIGHRPAFECGRDPAPPSVGLRRLTAAQYRNTVRDLVRYTLDDNDIAKEIVEALSESFDQYPSEERPKKHGHSHGTLRQLDQDVQQIHVSLAYDIGMGVGGELASKYRNELVGDCLDDGGKADACIEKFAETFGSRALRRPLDDEDVEFYVDTFYRSTSSNVDELALQELIAGFLTSPEFLYMVENGDKKVKGLDDAYSLTAHELANRLSYQLWQTMPDEELWKAANSGELLDDDGFEEQVDRMMKSNRARRASREFFADFLRLDRTADHTESKDKPEFRAFAADVTTGDTLRESMVQEVTDMLEYYTWDVDGTVEDILTSNRSFASGALADIYGVDAWEEGDDPVKLPKSDGRVGLLTRAAFLSSDRADTRPIMKGVFIRTALLCDEIPEPPPGAGNETVDLSKFTVRDGTEALTQQPGTSCVGCHENLINPLGFVTENFDALGRVREEEVHFGSDGKEIFSGDIRTEAVPRVFPKDKRTAADAEELAELIVESGKVEACLARNMLRFTYARLEDGEGGSDEDFEGSSDACSLERIRGSIDGGQPLRGMFKAAVMDPAFRRRTIVAE